ncbi:hypothetical protein Tco_0889169 [Tanacetum coccineum]
MDDRYRRKEDLINRQCFEIVQGDDKSKAPASKEWLDKRRSWKNIWKLVKAKHGNTRPEEGYERVLWGDLKTMFEHHVEDLI